MSNRINKKFVLELITADYLLLLKLDLHWLKLTQHENRDLINQVIFQCDLYSHQHYCSFSAINFVISFVIEIYFWAMLLMCYRYNKRYLCRNATSFCNPVWRNSSKCQALYYWYWTSNFCRAFNTSWHPGMFYS